ncbi:hypothetical protein HYV85_03490 [Candidatus Woesearchaeota archaeon]|nr:hypothetical protein [Candidatus Woesearchaeota archaeon]
MEKAGSLLERYAHVRTGQDLINAGVIPKSSAAFLAWIAFSRLSNLKAAITQSVEPEMLGSWLPAFAPVIKEVGEVISNRNDIGEYAKVGMRVRGDVATADNPSATLEGTIRDAARGSYLAVEWDRPIINSRSIKGVKEGYGSYVSYENGQVHLLVPGGKVVDGYQLANGVVADEKLGHRVRFVEGYESTRRRRDSPDAEVKIPKGALATLTKYDAERQRVTIRLDEKVESLRSNELTIGMGEALTKLQVSSLGQIEPKSLEHEVMKAAFSGFFPTTVLDIGTARDIVVGLLMGKDMVFYGPPGSGKSQAAKDIVAIAQQQEVIFHVEGCKVQCNPFSLFDPSFAKVVPACPECKINYDSGFKETGNFTPPKPQKVKVTTARYGEGKGIEMLEGTTGLQRMHLAGFKIPNLSDANMVDLENEFDPQGFHPGVLSRTNNGILFAEEFDKWRPQAWESLLAASQDSAIKPDQLRFSYPANEAFFGTANDPSVFPETINDRMLLIAIGYPQNRDDSYLITRRAYHKETAILEAVPVGDSHTQTNQALRQVPMPVIVERAVDAFYLKFRKEYTGPGKTQISGSNRSKLDALDAGRAELFLDSIFFEATPATATAEYAMRGIRFALVTRLQESSPEKVAQAKSSLDEYLLKEFPKAMHEEEDTWWCRVFQNMAIKETQAPGIEGAFRAEIASYKEDPRKALKPFQKVKAANESPQNPRLQNALLDHPFMAYLFGEQPKMSMVNERQLTELVSYLMASQASSSCK